MMGAMSVIEPAEEGRTSAKGDARAPMNHEVMHDCVEQTIERCSHADGNKSTYR